MPSPPFSAAAATLPSADAPAPASPLRLAKLSSAAREFLRQTKHLLSGVGISARADRLHGARCSREFARKGLNLRTRHRRRRLEAARVAAECHIDV